MAFPQILEPLQCKTFFNRYLGNGRSNPKNSKNEVHFFLRILLLKGPSPPSQLVPNPFNWSPNTVFCRYLSNGHSNKKIPNTKCIFYWIMLLGGPSPPSQLVPNPFNWSLSTVFCRYLSNGHSNKKIQKRGASFIGVGSHLLLYFLEIPNISDHFIWQLFQAHISVADVSKNMCKLPLWQHGCWAMIRLAFCNIN